ncbi:MAG: hypothetical protein HY941_08470 [Gammaproteobacteria bacterium]|nr:hypothetical protein [Gammaproteobacteria bacterium]
MLPPNYIEKVSRLVNVKFAERRRALPAEIEASARAFAASGGRGSGAYYSYVHSAIARELEIRAIQLWDAMVRVHRTLGAPLTDGLAEELIWIFDSHFRDIHLEVEDILNDRLKTAGAAIRQRLLLDQILSECRNKHYVEIELYVDSLNAAPTRQSESTQTTYNYFGSIGLIQTGAGAVAHVVQNIGSDDREALVRALDLVRDAISNSQELSSQRDELIEIADKCQEMIVSAQPNNSMLRGMFDVLAGSIQAIASAGPAYVAMKAALLPLGVTLP